MGMAWSLTNTLLASVILGVVCDESRLKGEGINGAPRQLMLRAFRLSVGKITSTYCS